MIHMAQQGNENLPIQSAFVFLLNDSSNNTLAIPDTFVTDEIVPLLFVKGSFI